MGLAGFISKIVTSITRSTFKFNKTLDDLILKFKDACPTTAELKALIQQKNQINGALVQIEQKIATLNKVAIGSEIAVGALKIGVTFIKQLPIPTSFPPGVGIPVSIINNFSSALDDLGTLVDKEEASIETIPKALDLISEDVGEVITKLNDLDVVLTECLLKDPNITQDDLNSIDDDATNFVGLISNDELNKLLNEPPGLLYGDYYLRKRIVPNLLTSSSLIKKQITAQNKESVIEGDFYNPGAPIETLLGDESFSSSNVVLVDEMKWLIDTKDLVFPPPPPAVDPLKELYKSGQLVILMSIYGANAEEADEIYELAWELSQGKGPNKGYFDTLVQKAFDNSRTVLEQAVANEGYEWKQGDRVLDATIKTLFLSDFAKTASEQELKGAISQLRKAGRNLLEKADEIGGSYNSDGKRWNNDGDFEYSLNTALYPYSERLAATAENNLNDSNIGIEYVSLREEMARRKPLMQAIFEAANAQFLAGRPYIFNDPLKEYFLSRDIGYNQPIINNVAISGNANESITSGEINQIYEIERDSAETYFNLNRIAPNYDITADGLTWDQIRAYSKTKVFLKLKEVLGIVWYNQNAQVASELPFWSVGGGNPQSQTYQQNNVNNLLTPSMPWYFEFGRNGLNIPTG
jgi:hypothetical protein